MSALAISFRNSVLPWAVSPEDEARFRRILNTVLAVCVIVCIVLLLLPKPQVDRAAPPEVPQRLAKLVLEQRETPPAPKAPPAPVSADQSKSADKPEVAKPLPDAKPLPKAVAPEARQPIPGKPPGEIEGARRKAAGVGLLAMKDQLAELFRTLASAPVLTVSEVDGFTSAGGMINFFSDDKKVRFEINNEMATRARLKISSKLLALGGHPGR